MSDFQNLYKFNDKRQLSQAARRANLLEEQREKRHSQFSVGRKQKSQRKKYRINYEFRNILMLSEWMYAAPMDLEDFFVVPCPKGIRCSLYVKAHNDVRLHYKNGKEFVKDISTNVPKDTLLDCIYAKDTNSVFVLDVIEYKARNFIDCDYAFRNYWMKSKFAEDELRLDDTLKLKLLETFDFSDSPCITSCYNKHPFFEDGEEIDGFLYYHKEGSYTSGETPLVLWLFPFMVEELMDFKVHSFYNTLKSDTYTDYKKFIYDFEQNRKKRGRRSRTSEMEVETSENTEFEIDPVQQSIDLERFGEY